MRRRLAGIVGIVVLVALLSAPRTAGQTLSELVRLRSQGESTIQGLGLVLGLPGTGDSADFAAMARSLAEVLRNNGSPVADLAELEDTSSIALVMVTCRIPETGALENDRFDVQIATVGNASSLRGGTLFLAPLRGPFPGDPVFAIADGKIELEAPDVPTAGIVRQGAQMVRPVLMQAPGSGFDLAINPAFAGWAGATQLANRINQEWFGTTRVFGDPIATVRDERTIKIVVPEEQRTDVPAFVAEILATPIALRSLNLPATIIVNKRTGIIQVSGDVRIDAVAITHKDLVISTTTPAPVPLPEAPLVERSRWAPVGTDVSEPDQAKLDDLLAAFNRLDVSVEDQIDILQMLQKTGRLHAKLVIE